HPFLGQLNPELPGVVAQRRGLRPDRLVLLLPGAGDPGAGRRARHGAAFLPGRPGSGPAVVVPEWRRPPTNRWPRDGRRHTRPRPSGRSPARRLSAAPRQELLHCLGHHGRDRPPGRREQPNRPASILAASATGTPASARSAAALTRSAYSAPPARSPAMP